ncbi:MAG: hypothetical protein M3P13_09705 [Acidobacteriota bacterium]|nr:hypothetical protein [Acidobacteriota bacterium]
MEGDVLLVLAVDDRGEVSDARVLSSRMPSVTLGSAGVDEHLRVVISDNGQGGITVTIVS